jgi:glycosyltransferase involved in cell wall biosynthesis
MKKVCLLTTAQPSTNPRLVKEADALVEAGYQVVVIGAKWIKWADKFDQEILSSKAWDFIEIKASPKNRARYLFVRIRYKISKSLFDAFNIFSLAGASKMTLELLERAKEHSADLYIAHNLGALPAAVLAAKRNNAKIGFDAEDFHSAETTDVKITRMNEAVEKKYLSYCDYVTAASDPIAQAYADKYGIRKPLSVLNVFPLVFLQEAPKKTREELSLYWFSQTIGPGRGVEDVIRAMGRAKNDIRLYLQGTIGDDYRNKLLRLAVESQVGETKIHFLAPGLPDELFEIASRFDIGLALEQKQPPNRDLCVTNKIFTYLLAGLSVIATDTQGQRPVVESIGRGGWLYKAGDIQALSDRIDFLAEHKEELETSRREALRWAKERFNWDLEKKKFLLVIDQTLRDQN